MLSTFCNLRFAAKASLRKWNLPYFKPPLVRRAYFARLVIRSVRRRRRGFCFVLRVLQPVLCQERFFASAMPCHPPCAESKSSKAYAVRSGFYFARLVIRHVRRGGWGSGPSLRDLRKQVVAIHKFKQKPKFCHIKHCEISQNSKKRFFATFGSQPTKPLSCESSK